MTATEVRGGDRAALLDSTTSHIGALTARYGLVVVIAWIGALKFTSYEAQGIQPLVAHSPLMSWVYSILSVPTFSAVLGVVELSTAMLLAVKPWFPRLSLVGSVLAIGLFLATVSFLFTTPGISVSCSPRPESVSSPQAAFRCCPPQVNS
jgi:uncharacterized membrane protein YkgB